MLSNIDSADLKLRRFLVLEDVDSDFEIECKFLCDICELCTLEPPDDQQKVEAVEIIRLRTLPPRSHRMPVGVAGDGYLNRRTPTFLTAPLAITRSEGELYQFKRDGQGWSTPGVCSLPSDPTLVVPWRTTSLSAANYYMPHAVLLDIVTDHSKNTFLATKRLLRGAWYPSDLVWVLSAGGGGNEPYGIFFPKFEMLGRAKGGEARAHVLRRLGSIFAGHARRHRGYKKDEQGVSSYLDDKARIFYEDFVMKESWRTRVQLIGNYSEPDKQATLQAVWSRATGAEAAAKKTFRWAVTDTPAKNPGVFSFFTSELKGEDQWRYASGTTFGLPFDYLWDDPTAKAPEDVIEEAARRYVDRQTSFVFRRNLAVFLYMVLGSMNNFNGLNAAIPSLDLSQGTFHGIANEVLGDEFAAAQLAVKASRKTGGRGRPFVDWLNNKFLGSI